MTKQISINFKSLSEEGAEAFVSAILGSMVGVFPSAIGLVTQEGGDNDLLSCTFGFHMCDKIDTHRIPDILFGCYNPDIWETLEIFVDGEPSHILGKYFNLSVLNSQMGERITRQVNRTNAVSVELLQCKNDLRDISFGFTDMYLREEVIIQAIGHFNSQIKQLGGSPFDFSTFTIKKH